MDRDLDQRVRLAAFAWLDQQRQLQGDKGDPRISNGLALCKLHHAAFDAHIIGVTPDYAVQVRLDILEERNGPMLEDGLQSFHGKPLLLPKRDAHQPDRGFLEQRYALFRRAS